MALKCPQCGYVIAGATGTYPYGSTGADDEGGLNAILTIDRAHQRLRLDFATSISFVSMVPDEARAFALELLKKADQLKPS